MTEASGRSGRRAFTLIELLVVIGIIVLLISILIPVVGKVREKAQIASVQSQINSIDSAVQAYSIAFGGALPGPIPNSQLGPTTPAISINITGGGTIDLITGSENLTLGLLGGLKPLQNGTIEFDPAAVSKGPRGLKISNPKSNTAFLEGVPLTPPRPAPVLSGEFVDDSGDANDSRIPEIVDSFPDPMPILYLRATKGAAGVISGQQNRTIQSPSGTAVPAQYALNDIDGYINATTGHIGVGKRIRLSDYSPSISGPDRPHGLKTVTETATLDKGSTYPFDAFPYFRNPAMAASATTNLNFNSQPHNKDGFILISAGADRVYGTRDDITNFGAIGQ